MKKKKVMLLLLIICGVIAVGLHVGDYRWKAKTRDLRGRLEAARLPVHPRSLPHRRVGQPSSASAAILPRRDWGTAIAVMAVLNALRTAFPPRVTHDLRLDQKGGARGRVFYAGYEVYTP